ncbi:unnamed protein product [Ceratitis capitata]|uniref:(Mediterranean fruit fly) hypothetical protein n=1 Tax=Ceratitis capitata TaxID=7213 RepID=A0A811VE98_CERCA|nr:unnamed protein product [Ceratitis capitata]
MLAKHMAELSTLQQYSVDLGPALCLAGSSVKRVTVYKRSENAANSKDNNTDNTDKTGISARSVHSIAKLEKISLDSPLMLQFHHQKEKRISVFTF